MQRENYLLVLFWNKCKMAWSVVLLWWNSGSHIRTIYQRTVDHLFPQIIPDAEVNSEEKDDRMVPSSNGMGCTALKVWNQYTLGGFPMLLEGYHLLWSSLLSEGMHHSLCCFMMPKWTLFCMCDQASPFVQKKIRLHLFIQQILLFNIPAQNGRINSTIGLSGRCSRSSSASCPWGQW